MARFRCAGWVAIMTLSAGLVMQSGCSSSGSSKSHGAPEGGGLMTGIGGAPSAGGTTGTGGRSATSGGTGQNTGGVLSTGGGPDASIGGMRSTGGSGGEGGVDTHSFATALPLAVDAASPTAGMLPAPPTSKDYYSFAGKKGEAIEILTATAGAPFDPKYTNLVATLYDAGHIQLALNDDPWPRVSNAADLFTVLPADGTYYIVVNDCSALFSVSACGDPSTITNFGYTIKVTHVGAPAVTGEGPEPANDLPVGAAVVAYSKPAATYALSVLHGLFQTSTDKDYYSFTVPLDAPVPAVSRARADFWITSSGLDDGNGSTASPGKVYVIDPADSSTHMAELDGTLYGNAQSATSGPANLSVPVQLNKQYYLVVERSSQSAGANDFYFIQHFGGSLDTPAPSLELDSASNDVSATAETLAAINRSDGTYWFQVDGHIDAGLADMDWYRMEIPAGITTISGACQAQRRGSGLQGLNYQLLRSDGTTSIAAQTESAATDNAIPATALPAGPTSVLLKVSAQGMSPTVTDTSYVCRFLIHP